MKHLLIVCISLVMVTPLYSQKTSLSDIKTENKPLQNIPLYSDSLTSSFYILIEKEVKPHFHEFHSEHVYVVAGVAEMKLGDKTFTIKAGDIIFIPKNTVHSVTVTNGPLKVISIQAPLFDGTDRKWAEY